MVNNFRDTQQLLTEYSHTIYSRGWSPATSSNYSIKLSENSCAITASGKHKGLLTAADIMQVNFQGEALTPQKPSAETLLHTQLYQDLPWIGSVLHTHSKAAVLLSMWLQKQDLVQINGYELLKAFYGVESHTETVWLPIFENNQDIEALSQEVSQCLSQHEGEPVVGYLIRGHGLYTWGRDISECFKHLEALEYLLECEWTLTAQTKL